MKVVVFGPTGFIGAGVLKACLEDEGVSAVIAVARKSTGEGHPKLKEILHRDFSDFSALAGEFKGVDACFWCLGISSRGLPEERYREITNDYTMAAARVLSKSSPGLVFCYVSGVGADETLKSRMMWARVKGLAENNLKELPLRSYIFRPGVVLPVAGFVPPDPLVKFARPLLFAIHAIAPGAVVRAEEIGRAMLRCAREKPEARMYFNADMIALGR